MQSWYGALENMHFSLPDDEAREKAAGEAWPLRIERFKEAALSVSSVLDTYHHVCLCCQHQRASHVPRLTFT